MATPPTASPAATALAAPLPPAYAPHVAVAIDAVRLAATLTARVQASLKRGDAVSKEDASPVTVADYGAQALVAWSLAAACAPPLPLVAEEDADDLRADSGAGMAARVTALVNEVLKTARPAAPPLTTAAVLDLIDTGASPGGADGMHWVLDPIDGTRGFVGGRQYAVCLGLLHAGRLAAGVLGCPNLPAAPLTAADGGRVVDDASFGERDGALFFAAAGGGAWTAPLAGPGAAGAAPARIHAARGDADPASLRFMESYESAHSDFGVAARAAAALGVTAPPLRLDSQAKYGALARGDAAINMRFPRPGYREKIWDHAAGVLIAVEAGAVVTDAGGAPLDFSRGRWLDLDRGIVTAPPGLHARLVEALKKEGQQMECADPPLLWLPDAVLCDEILLRLPPPSLAAAAATCRALRRAAADGDAWRRKVGRDWGALPLAPTAGADGDAWRRLAAALGEGEDEAHSLVADALAASSTDNPEESVTNVLAPRSRPPPGSSAVTYWSSAGADDGGSCESISLALAHPLCIVRSIMLRPFRAWFQPGAPVYAPRAVRVRVARESLWRRGGEGGACPILDASFSPAVAAAVADLDAGPDPAAAYATDQWAYVSPELPVAPHGAAQTFALDPPILCPGGHLNLLLVGRTARQEVDGRHYTCLAHVAAWGRVARGAWVDPESGALASLRVDPLHIPGGLADASERGRPARLAARAAHYVGDDLAAATDDDGGSDDDDAALAAAAAAGDDPAGVPPPAALIAAALQRAAGVGGGDGGAGGWMQAVLAAFEGGLPGARPPPGGHAPRGGL